MMIVCGLGFLVGKFLTGPSYWNALGISISWVNPDWEAFLLYAASPIQGIFVGLLAGLLWRGWKSGVIFALAGGLIFTAGYWVNYSSWSFLYSRGLEQLVHWKIISAGLWTFICWLVGYTIFGGIVGFLWGIFLDRLPRMRFIGWSTDD